LCPPDSSVQTDFIYGTDGYIAPEVLQSKTYSLHQISTVSAVLQLTISIFCEITLINTRLLTKLMGILNGWNLLSGSIWWMCQPISDILSLIWPPSNRCMMRFRKGWQNQNLFVNVPWILLFSDPAAPLNPISCEVKLNMVPYPASVNPISLEEGTRLVL